MKRKREKQRLADNEYFEVKETLFRDEKERLRRCSAKMVNFSSRCVDGGQVDLLVSFFLSLS